MTRSGLYRESAETYVGCVTFFFSHHHQINQSDKIVDWISAEDVRTSPYSKPRIQGGKKKKKNGGLNLPIARELTEFSSSPY